MALGDAYLTTAEFKARTRSATAANDSAIAAVLDSASRSIDGFCGREFNKGATDESRIFDYWCYQGRWAYGGDACLELGDVVSIGAIASDDGSNTFPLAWDSDSYVLVPRNAAAKGRPYTEIARAQGASWRLTSYPIRVTGVFGWPAVPAPVKEVCFLAANRLKSLWDAPFGASGGGEQGSLDMTVSLTPIMEQMLAPYVVRTV